MSDSYARARSQADREFRDHRLTVLHDDGVYRHLRLSRPNTFMYGFDLVTWPGHLAIDGDIGAGFVFARLHDMVDFFAGDTDINPDYWSEKITNRAARDGTETYSRPFLEASVAQYLGYAAEVRDQGWLGGAWKAWKEHVEFVDLDHEHTAYDALNTFEHDGYRFAEWYEWRLKDWDHHFLLTCFAIKHGVAMYRRACQAVA